MTNRPDALQIWRRSQCSSESVRATWLYRHDAIQCLTSIRVSSLRHSYGKTAATVRTMSSIRQVMYTKFNRPDVNLHGPDDQASTIRTSPFRVRTLQSLIMEIMCSQSATFWTLGQHRPDTVLLWKLSVLLWKGGCSFGRSVKPSWHPPIFWS
jgi:hypothetical protein